jgi:DTW domain-containing protein YfiP
VCYAECKYAFAPQMSQATAWTQCPKTFTAETMYGGTLCSTCIRNLQACMCAIVGKFEPLLLLLPPLLLLLRVRALL